MEKPIIKWPRIKTEGGLLIPVGHCRYKFVEEGDAECVERDDLFGIERYWFDREK